MARRFGNIEREQSGEKKKGKNMWELKLGGENRMKGERKCERINVRSRRGRKKPNFIVFLWKRKGSIWRRIGTNELVDRGTTCFRLTYRDEIPLFRYHGTACDLESCISASISEEHCRRLVRLALWGARESATGMKSNCAKWGNRSLKRYETSFQISELGQIKSIALAKLPVDFHIRKMERDCSSLTHIKIQMNRKMTMRIGIDLRDVPKIGQCRNEWIFEFIYI